MRNYWQGTLLLFLFITLWGNIALAQKNSGPVMVLKEQTFDFGEVEEGEVIEHAFQVLNQGDRTLNITKVKAG